MSSSNGVNELPETSLTVDVSAAIISPDSFLKTITISTLSIE